MPTTYSPNLRIELIGTGEQANVWGNTTNRNLGTLIEDAIAGQANIVMANSDYTLSVVDGFLDEARQMILNVTGTNSQVRNIICPSVSKVYIVKNATTGGFSITVKTSTGAGVTVPNGKTAFVYSNGTDFFNAVEAINNVSITGGSITNLDTPLAVNSGGTGANNAATARTNLQAAASGINNDITALTALTTPIAISGGGTGAASARTARNNLLPTQAGNTGKFLTTDGTDVAWDAVNISTADITGVLPIANGGTNASTAGVALTNLGAAPTASPTFTGAVTVNGSTNANGQTRGNVTAVGALNVDCSQGNYFTKTITTGTNTFTFSNVPSGAFAFVLELNQVGGTVAWPASVYWPNNTTPSLTSGRVHLFVLITADGGTVFHGAALTNYVA
jgi:hypothetical protein